jgi:hypothetical protein
LGCDLAIHKHVAILSEVHQYSMYSPNDVVLLGLYQIQPIGLETSPPFSMRQVTNGKTNTTFLWN